MVLTANYGLKHNFYFGRLESAEGGQLAKLMYAGALLWLVSTTMAFAWSIGVTRQMNGVTGSDTPKRQGSKRTRSEIAEKLIKMPDAAFTWLGEKLEYYWMDKNNMGVLGETSLLAGGERNYMTMYCTLPVQSQGNLSLRKELAKIYAVTAMIMFLLWSTQYMRTG